MNRASGILMPITSLPSPYGIGTIGKAAYEFADFLKKAGQSYWQILPVGPTSYGDSPYQSFSTYAGNPYMIDLDMLQQDGLLKKKDYRNLNWGDDPEHVDYARIYELRFRVLRIAFNNAQKGDLTDFNNFVRKNSAWLENYALYMAVKKSFGMRAWTEWEDEGIRLRDPDSVRAYRRNLDEDVRFYEFLQYLFYKQWEKFRGYVNSLGIKLFGDILIYVAMDSADTWANPEVFWLDEERHPVRVAGCPPDYFSATGQLWGNPLYDWEYLKSTGYKWWIDRIAAASKLYDVTRIDHFRGFDEYYSIPYPAKDAVIGDWLKGPGMDLFNAIRARLGDVPIIAEDLGLITPGVAKLLKDSGYPGMKVLQFAFDDRGESVYLPHLYTNNYVVYTGTHDNDTTEGWFANASEGERRFATEYAHLSPEEGYAWGMIRAINSTVADLCIAPMQDVLELGSWARMNTPSTLGGNWQWRMKPGEATEARALRLRRIAKTYGRLPAGQEEESQLEKDMVRIAKAEYCKELQELNVHELHMVLGKAVMGAMSDQWADSRKAHAAHRRAYYFSAEFLMGRMVYNNLFELGLLDKVKAIFEKNGLDIAAFEDVEDAALGNGGLGRLAACFLDSAAAHDIPLDGYGIKYKYGLFKQTIENGFQCEQADDWTHFGDPWCIRREEDRQLVEFAGQKVWAVPYDMAVIGYGTKNIGTLRLWQAEALTDFDFAKFNDQHYLDAVRERNEADDISKVLYPNDNGYEGKVLRLKQQYFFCSASLKDIIKRYKKVNGDDLSGFAMHAAIQLNDTHPVISIPELIRLLELEGMSFDEAFQVAQKTFAYTNHTVMAEAMERWDVKLMKSLLPEVYAIIEKIDEREAMELATQPGMDEVISRKLVPDEEAIAAKKAEKAEKAEEAEEEEEEETPMKEIVRTRLDSMRIIDEGAVHMARLAVYASSYTNGVAEIHTQILKDDVLKDWYAVYPERFQNKTNGITQRRWLGLCNPQLCSLLDDCVGEGYMKNLDLLADLNDVIDDETIDRFNAIKFEKKKELCAYIEKHEGIRLDPNFVFDIQVKRLHEYKRQLLNAFSILDIYRKLKKGEIAKWTPTAFIFGAKAAPGYFRAKGIIKYIGEIAKMINNDPEMDDKMKVVFISNYNVSYAEKLMCAADISEQISTAGTEASGTGNMKFMLNGTVTLGTYDGANVEIVQQAGEENNYIFGARVEEINEMKPIYNPNAYLGEDANLRAIVETLIDGTFDDDGTGMFKELYTSLTEGASWHKPDNYFLIYDEPDYVKTKLRAIADYQDRRAFGLKCLRNIAGAGKFSSDRTIQQYAKELWKL